MSRIGGWLEGLRAAGSQGWLHAAVLGETVSLLRSGTGSDLASFSFPFEKEEEKEKRRSEIQLCVLAGLMAWSSWLLCANSQTNRCVYTIDTGGIFYTTRNERFVLDFEKTEVCNFES